MVNINLLPQEILEKQKLQQVSKLVLMCGSVIALVLVILLGIKISELPSLNSRILYLDKELKQVQPIVDEVNKLKGIKTTLEARKQLVEQLLTSGLVYPRFMMDLMEVLPEGIWFTSMNTTSIRGPDKNITLIKVNLNCNSYDKIVIADFVSNLENKNNLFKEIKLGPINVTPDKNYELHTFNISFDYIVPQQQTQK
jgi:Tfp pilus assembly protein PilN